MKAKFITKYYGTGYDRDFVYLEYEYRGYRYTIYENHGKGNEPLSWQHRAEQARIDKIIEMENDMNNETRSENIDEVLNNLFTYWNS